MSAMLPHPVGEVGPGDHVCLSFTSGAEQREVVTTFVRNGLARREKVYYFADIDPAAIPGFLEAGGTAASEAVDNGQLAVVAAGEAYLPGGSFDPEAVILQFHRLIDAALGEGYAGFRVTAEMTWMLRHGLSAEAVASYEKAATTVFKARSAAALCQYDQRRFPGELLAAAQAAHLHTAVADPLYADALVTVTRVYDPVGLRVAGDIDMTNACAWQSVVAAAANGHREVHVDLSSLGFIDVQGVRALVRAADGITDGGQLVVDSPPAEFVRVLRLLGWDQSTNLLVAGE